MIQNKNVTKLLCALFSAGGELTRKELSNRVFRRNLRSAALDALLASPELVGLIGKTRAPRRASPGTRFARCATRYYLTVAGWTVLVRGLKRGIRPVRINAEAIREHLQRLRVEADPWALQIEQDRVDAQKWREHVAKLEAERRAKEASAAQPGRVLGSQSAAPVTKADEQDWRTFREAVGLGRQSR